MDRGEYMEGRSVRVGRRDIRNSLAALGGYQSRRFLSGFDKTRFGVLERHGHNLGCREWQKDTHTQTQARVEAVEGSHVFVRR